MLYFLIIFVGVIFLGIAFCSFDDELWSWLAAITFAIAIILGCFMFYNYTTRDAHQAELEQEYNALVYKCESDKAKDDHGFLNKEYIDEIEDWNTTLAYHKGVCRNFWVGIFYPNIYDDLNYIDYNNIQYRYD